MSTVVTNRERLLEAAREELVADGGSLEMKSVAGRAGVSVGLAYHHFGSKAGLLAAVVEDFHDRLEAAASNVRYADTHWADREHGRIRDYVRFHYTDPVAPLMLGRLVTEPEVVAVQQERMERAIATGTRNIRQAQRDGDIAADLAPDTTVAMLLGGMRQAVATALEADPPPPCEVVAEQLWALIVRAVGIDPLAIDRAPATKRRSA